jgi:putative ABC transport system permease protein
LLVAVALRGGLDPNDLKLVTAVFVLGALILPKVIGARRKRPRQPVAARAA